VRTSANVGRFLFGRFSARRIPWCRSTIERTIVRPIPRPWGFVEKNGSKRDAAAPREGARAPYRTCGAHHLDSEISEEAKMVYDGQWVRVANLWNQRFDANEPCRRARLQRA